jgi:heme/copper-type cytochrome/quinol oxidase subunit 2
MDATSPTTKYTKGLFLLILTISGNFMGETLGCKTRKLLTENIYAKYLVTLFVIFFAVDFTDDKNLSPLDNFISAFKIFIMFIIFTRMSLPFTIVAFLGVVSLYVINQYIDYYEIDKEKNKEIIHKLKRVNNILLYIIIFIIIIGFLLYTYKQYKDHKKDFSILKFIFGVLHCKND